MNLNVVFDTVFCITAQFSSASCPARSCLVFIILIFPWLRHIDFVAVVFIDGVKGIMALVVLS